MRKFPLKLSTQFALVPCCTIPSCRFYYSLVKKITSGHTECLFTFISCPPNSLICECKHIPFHIYLRNKISFFFWYKGCPFLTFYFFLEKSIKARSRNYPRNSHQARVSPFLLTFLSLLAEKYQNQLPCKKVTDFGWALAWNTGGRLITTVTSLVMELGL